MYHKHHFDFDQLPFLTSPRHQLALKAVALGLIHLPAGQGYTFTHSHEEQEEVYIVISGKGFLWIEKEMIPLEKGDIVRVDPADRRALKAQDGEDLFVICSGAVASQYPKNPTARYLIDDGIPYYDDIPPWYEGRKDIEDKNKILQEKMIRSKEKQKQIQEEKEKKESL